MNAAASVTANFTLQDFSLKAASSALTVQPGGQGTDVLTLAGVNGPFTNPVQLTCAVTGTAPLPPCTFSQASVTPGTNSATSTMTITAGTAALAAIANHREGNRWQLALCMTLLFGFTFIAAPRRQRQPWALCSFLLLMFGLQTACGGSGSNPPPTPKNFNVTVTATSGSITHATQVAVTVQ